MKSIEGSLILRSCVSGNLLVWIGEVQAFQVHSGCWWWQPSQQQVHPRVAVLPKLGAGRVTRMLLDTNSHAGLTVEMVRNTFCAQKYWLSFHTMELFFPLFGSRTTQTTRWWTEHVLTSCDCLCREPWTQHKFAYSLLERRTWLLRWWAVPRAHRSTIPEGVY